MNGGKRSIDTMPGGYDASRINSYQPLSSSGYGTTPSWDDKYGKQQSYDSSDDEEELPPISKIKDGLFIGSMEASISTDVCFILRLLLLYFLYFLLL